MAVAGEDMDQVTQLGSAIAQRKSSSHVNDYDAIELSC